MTEALTTNSKSKPRSGRKGAVGRLFVLELSGGRIHSMSPDGSDRKVIVTDCHLPDGIVVDVGRRPYLLDQHGPSPSTNDGSIERADLDGRNCRVIVPQGVTHTPKQIHLDKDGGKLYWCDREGMRVMRANLDGSQVETLVETGRGDKDRRDQTTVVRRNHHRSEASGKSTGRKKVRTMAGWAVSSAPISTFPKARPPANRSDIEVLFDQPAGTHRSRARSGEPRALLDRPRRPSARQHRQSRTDRQKAAAPEIVITHLMEGIGIALDVPGNRMFVTDFAGSIYSADLDG